MSQDLRYLRHQAWSIEDGLPQDSVHQIAQTPDGYIWIATERGITRFDGVSFQTLNSERDPAFVSDDACCVVVATNGDLWIGTEDGLIRRRGGELRRFSRSDGLPSEVIKKLVPLSDNTLLVLTAAGLVQLRNGVVSTPPSLPSLDSISSAEGNGAWLISGRRLMLLQGNALKPRAVNIPAQSVGLLAAAGGSNGIFWTATHTEVSLNAKTLTKSWKVGPALSGSRIESLFVDRSGTAWVGTNDGLSVIRPDGGDPVAIAPLRGNTILTVFEDREGNDWIGTETSGLHVLRPLTFRTEPVLADRSVTTVVQASDGAAWVGTWNDGLYRLQINSAQFEDSSAQARIRVGSLTSPVILSLAPGANGSVWAGTPDGLNHVDTTGKVRQITAADGLPDEYVESLAASSDGSVWVGTRHGLAHLKGKTSDVFTRADGLGGDVIGALLLTHRGELWAATANGLSNRAVDGKIRTLQRGLNHRIVTALTEDGQGRVWEATDTGEIGRVDADAVRSAYRPATAVRVMGLVTDARGSLWVRTKDRFESLPLDSLNHCVDAGLPCSIPITRYELADGLPSEEVAEAGWPMLWRMTDGEVWAATRRGVAIVDPGHLPHNTLAPGVVIERLLVGDDSVDLGRQPITLPYSHARLTMEYAGLSYTVPSKVRYRIMLEGFDRTWINVGSRRSATYTNLPPRAYRFRVQAMNNSGVWSEAGAELRFQIVPPLYRRWWFLSLMFLLLLTLLFWLYQLRLRWLRARFEDVLKERNRIAREIHDTLAQDFVGVSIQLDLIAQYLAGSKSEQAVLQVQQTRKLVTEGLKEARQSIWALRSNLDKDSLPTELGKLVKRYRERSLAVELAISGPFRPLGAIIEGEVLRVAQEALSNVARHSGAESAAVTLRYGRDMLVLLVEDQGRGFNLGSESERDGHYGLRGLRERAESIGGTLKVVTGPGQGTKVNLQVPIDFFEELL